MKIRSLIGVFALLFASEIILLLFALAAQEGGAWGVALYTSVSLVLNLIFALLFYNKILLPLKSLAAYTDKLVRGEASFGVNYGGIHGELFCSIQALEEELTRARGAEDFANKSRRDMMVSINHNVKNPITSIRDIAELLQMRVEPGKERSQLEAICAKAEYVGGLLDEMLEALPEEEDEVPMTITREPSSVLYEVINHADYDCNCAFVGAIPKCEIMIDKRRLEQVLHNIISNAYKYAGTRVTIHTELSGEHLSLTLRDYGPGVEPAELIGLFDRRFRGRNSAGRSGTGFGLYLCWFYMERMNGVIRCENFPDGFGVTVGMKLVQKNMPEQLMLDGQT